MVVIVRSQAERDITQAIDYYLDQEAPTAADRFLDAVEAAYPEIRDAPLRYPPDDQGVRQKPVLGFPFSILYTVAGAEITVHAVRHHSRKPGFWENRL